MYSKFLCLRHPEEQITNFCADTNCLIGLCATCISQHAQYHKMNGSSPKFENIKHTQNKYEERVKDQIIKIGNDKQWLGLINQQIQEKKQNIGLTLAKVRKDCLAVVNAHFDGLQGKINHQIVNQNKKNLLHSPYRFEKLNTLLLKQFNDLINVSKNLQTEHFFAVVKQLETEIFPSSDHFHLRISKELKENQVYSTGVVYRQELLTELQSCIKKLIKMEYILPKVQFIPDIKNYSTKQNRPVLTLQSPNKSSIQGNYTISDLAMKYSVPTPMTSAKYWKYSPYDSFSSTTESKFRPTLQIIRQTQRQDLQQQKTLNNSFSSAKLANQTRLAYSTYCDSQSNFFR